MATNNGGLIGLYGSGSGSYGDANVIYLLGGSGTPYQYPILTNNSITTTGNLVGNLVIANNFAYPNGISLTNTLYSNVNAASYLPTYVGNTGATLTTSTQTNITAVGPLVNLTFASNVNANSWVIHNVQNPSLPQDAATKTYVDNFVQGLQIKEAVSYATAAALPAYTYVNGPLNDGVGATLTGISIGNLTIDGVVPTPGTRVLVKNETGFNAPYNGIYVVTTQGPASYYVLTRATDMDEALDFYGAYNYVSSGATQHGTTWVDLINNNQVMVVGTTAVPYTQFSTPIDYTGGPGITVTTGEISANVDGVTIGLDGNGQLYATGVFTGNAPVDITTANITTTNITTANITSAVGDIAIFTTVNSTNISASGNILATGNISATGNITAPYFFGNGSQLTGMYGNSNVQSYLPTYAGALNGVGNVISTGIVQAQSIIGNISISTVQNLSVGNLEVSGNASTTGNTVTLGTSSVTGNISTANYFVGNGYYLTGLNIPASYSNANVAAYLPTYGGAIQVSGITNANANGVGNIGSSGLYFDTVFAKATSAQYADLAEMYLADKQLEPGTVVEIGGSQEIRATTNRLSTAVIGVVSTNPSYLMNSTIQGEFPTAVALTGRVPCKVAGVIRKGDLLVSSAWEGVATAMPLTPAVGTVIGKALENYNGPQQGIIEVLVGRV